MTLSTTIHKLRTNANLTQERFAELFNVSQQSVQKWESGTVQPDLNKLISISKYFNISMDELIFNNASNPGNLTHNREFQPQYDNIHPWESYSAQIMTEYTQSIEEGLDISSYKRLFEAVNSMSSGQNKEKMSDILFDIVSSAPQSVGFSYNEPSSLEEIKSLRKPYKFNYKMPDSNKLHSKIHGAWMGRICGCALGKPVEGVRRKDMIPLLKALKNYPLTRYIYAKDVTKEVSEDRNYKQPDNFFVDFLGHAPADDDTNYVVLAQLLIDKYGRDFTPLDVSKIWLQYQTKDAYCTAERVAFCNFVKGYAPPVSAQYKNPFREWIGAQIRGDYFGYINPGNPELAAEMAWRDASISHTKNGIYGEMFASAMIACAAVTDSITNIIEGGLAQIPATSRLYEEIRNILSDYLHGADKDSVFDKIHNKYDEALEHYWCHTIPNAMIVVASLLYGNGDFGKSICMAVETGFDTDCNAATIGSVLGMRNGIDRIGKQWTEPIHDTLDTGIFTLQSVTVSECAKNTIKHLQKEI